MRVSPLNSTNQKGALFSHGHWASESQSVHQIDVSPRNMMPSQPRLPGPSLNVLVGQENPKSEAREEGLPWLGVASRRGTDNQRRCQPICLGMSLENQLHICLEVVPFSTTYFIGGGSFLSQVPKNAPFFQMVTGGFGFADSREGWLLVEASKS